MANRARVLIWSARVLVIAFGVTALWFTRDGLNPDGIAYLDASDEYLAGRWPRSGSGYWSPLYPTLLAVARWIGGKSPDRALALAQAVNLGLFLLAYLAFEWLLRSLRTTRTSRDDAATPNESAWYLLAYAMFAVTTVGWIRVWLLTPDMGLAALVFASAAVAVRIADGRGRWMSAIALGALLAAGYLMKAALFPVAIIILITLGVVIRRRGGVALTAVATGVFLAISTPQIVYVSRLKGSPTFSDVGRLSYLWFVADVPGPVSAPFALPARLPDPAGRQTLATLTDSVPRPAIYDIDAPIPGTLPIWYDAGHWYRGVVAPFKPVATVRALVRHTRVYLEMFGVLIAGALAAALAATVSRRTIAAMRPNPLLVVPAILTLAMYALVLVQPRYVAPFALILVLGLVPPSAVDELSRRVRIGLATGAVVGVIAVVYQLRVDTPVWRGSAAARANVVSALNDRGVGAGARVAFIGDGYEALWAHQAGVRFVTLLPRPEAGRFWALDAAGRARVLERMRSGGATVVLAEAPPPGVLTDGWEQLPSGGPPAPPLLVYAEPAPGLSARAPSPQD
jgi:hypothetical protein